MLKIVHMKVNGKEVELAVDERESLLDTLRQRLGLTSVKKGCEVGECGACTVLVNGEAIDSCIYMTLWAEGRKKHHDSGRFKGAQWGIVTDSEGIYRGGSRTVRLLYSRPYYERGGDCGNRKKIQPGRA